MVTRGRAPVGHAHRQLHHRESLWHNLYCLPSSSSLSSTSSSVISCPLKSSNHSRLKAGWLFATCSSRGEKHSPCIDDDRVVFSCPGVVEKDSPQRFTACSESGEGACFTAAGGFDAGPSDERQSAVRSLCMSVEQRLTGYIITQLSKNTKHSIRQSSWL